MRLVFGSLEDFMAEMERTTRDGKEARLNRWIERRSVDWKDANGQVAMALPTTICAILVTARREETILHYREVIGRWDRFNPDRQRVIEEKLKERLAQIKEALEQNGIVVYPGVYLPDVEGV